MAGKKYIVDLEASKFITTGGLSSEFVKGDGSLDSASYSTQTLSLGTDHQVPFMNGAADFQYTSKYTFDDVSNKLKIEDTTNVLLYTIIDGTGVNVIDDDNDWALELRSDRLTYTDSGGTDVDLIFPTTSTAIDINLPSSAGTLALTSDISLNLQQVTDVGSTTTNNLIVSTTGAGFTQTATYSDDTITFYDVVNADEQTFNLILPDPLTGTFFYNLTLPQASGTLALTSDLLSKGSDNQIPVMNGTTDFDYSSNLTFDTSGFKVDGGSSSGNTNINYNKITLTKAAGTNAQIKSVGSTYTTTLEFTDPSGNGTYLIPTSNTTKTLATTDQIPTAYTDLTADIDYLRADVDDTASGFITFSGSSRHNDGSYAYFGTGNDMAIYHLASNSTNYMTLYNGDFKIFDSPGATTRFTFGRSTGDFTATGDIIGDQLRVGTNTIGYGTGTLELRSDNTNPPYIQFTEDGVGFRGQIGFEAGSSTFVVKSGGNGIANGTLAMSVSSSGDFTAIGTLNASINAATTDTDKFLVDDGGTIKYRTGAEVLSDIGAAANQDYLRADVSDVKTSGTLTFNDNVAIGFGNSNDMNMYHNGVHLYENLNTGNKYIRDGTTNRFIFERTTGKLTLTGELQGKVPTSYSTYENDYYFKDIPLDSTTSYERRVLTLVPKSTTSTTQNRMVVGKLIIGKYGGNIFNSYDIDIQSVYNSTIANVRENRTSTGEYAKLVEFTYNGDVWIGLKLSYQANPFTYASFYGYATDDTSSGDQLEIISYYNEDTSTVINSDINSTITDYTGTVTDFRFLTGDVRIDNGTTNPELYFSNEGTNYGSIRGTSSGPVLYSADSTYAARFYNNANYINGNLYIRNSSDSGSSADQFMFDTTNVRLGIGDTSPSYSLDVNGDGRFTSYIEALDKTRKEVTDDATTTHTVTATDAYKLRRFTSSSAITVTVDTGSLTNIGETAEIDQYGTGLVTISAGTATLRVNGNATLVSSGQYSRISIQKMTSTEYRVFGELEPA